MLIALLKKLGQQLLMLFVIVLLLVAAYLSLGRQFIPVVSRYKSFFEEQIALAIGVPTTIQSLTGYFENYSPALVIDGLRITVPTEVDEPDGNNTDPNIALEFAQAAIIIDVPRSLLARRWVLGNFLIEDMAIKVLQKADASWQLSGINLNNSADFSLADAYQALQRVSHLELRNLSVNLESQNGSTTQFSNVSARIQNSGIDHYIHIDANMDGATEEIQLSMEVSGDELGRIDGMIYARVPEADYSPLLRGQKLGDYTFEQLGGGGHLWLQLVNGQLQRVTVQPDLEFITVLSPSNRTVSVESLSGRASLTRSIGADIWELSTNALSFNWTGRPWRSDSYIYYAPQQSIGLLAEQLDIGILHELGSELGLITGALEEQLDSFGMRGQLHNFSAFYPLSGTSSNERFNLSGNMVNLSVNSVRNSPSMAGLNGFLQINYDPELRIVSGMAEVESENFSINIPTVFTDVWSHDFVNGSVAFTVDLEDRSRLKLVSNVITAESDIVDGKVQFSSNRAGTPDVDLESELSLRIAAIGADGARKGPYLPSAPNLRPGLLNAMRWLDTAVINADVQRAGIVFHGEVFPSEIALKKSFQGIFEFEQGRVRYADGWPEVQGVSGTAVVNNEFTDVFVASGNSLGLQLAEVFAQVIPDQENIPVLTISGLANGETAQGLNFLVNSPIGPGLTGILASWQAQGEVAAEIDVRLLLDGKGQTPHVKVAAQIGDNSLYIPEHALDFNALTGRLNYDSIAGFTNSELSGQILDGEVTIALASEAGSSSGLATLVTMSGSVGKDALIAWPGQTRFVRDVLRWGEGQINYTAGLRIFPQAGDNAAGELRINSDLRGMSLALPAPFGKAADSLLPLNLHLGFGVDPQQLSVVVGQELNMRVTLENGQLGSGVAHIGTVPGAANPWQILGDKAGLEVRGSIDVFEAEEWVKVLRSSDPGSASRGMRDILSSIRLDVGTLDLFGQKLMDTNIVMQQLQDTDYWAVALEGEAVSGTVLLPFDTNNYIEAYLHHLYLPGSAKADEDANEVLADAEPAATSSVEEVVERVDALAQLDPHLFPRLKFRVGDLTIGGSEFGLGQFTLDPTPEGAVFTNLIANFRGLNAGLETPESARMHWSYDGTDHRSELHGIFTAGNLADVLVANGYAPSLESRHATFDTNLSWPGTPGFFSAATLSGDLRLTVEDGRFRQGGSGALRLISIINFDAIMRRARFSGDLLRSGISYDTISGSMSIQNGVVTIRDQLIISGPSSLYQIYGVIDLAQQTIDGEMYLTLPLSNNIPWIGLLTANIPLAIGGFLFERIFGAQINSLTSALYTLQGPWEGLQPQFKQAFGSAPASTTTSNAGIEPVNPQPVN